MLTPPLRALKQQFHFLMYQLVVKSLTTSPRMSLLATTKELRRDFLFLVRDVAFNSNGGEGGGGGVCLFVYSY